MASVAKNLYVVIAGVGPGTGAAIANRFASMYPVALLARSQSTLDPLVKSIEAKGGKALAIPTDITSEKSVSDAFELIKSSSIFEGRNLGVAIYNVGGGFVRKAFLELTLDEFEGGWLSNGRGAFFFAQKSLPLLLKTAAAMPKGESSFSPSLLFTGATASLKGGPRAAAFAAGKFAQRALAQSLAREYGPEGVHTALLRVDGVIDIEKSKDYVVQEGAERDGKIDTEEIAEVYWNLFSQGRAGWTQELDIRPATEKW